MNEEMILNLGTEAVKTTVLIAGPLLLVSLVVGLAVSIFQAVTQINEATLTFIPKMIAMGALLAVMSPWMLEIMRQYTSDILGNAGNWVR